MRISDWSSDVCSSDLHVEAAADTIVGKFGLACRTDDEERRSLPDRDARWKLDKRLPPVVEGAERPPCRLIAADNVVEMKAVDRQALRNRCRSRSLLGGPAQCDQLVRGIGPGQRRHRGARGGGKQIGRAKV